MAGTAQTPFYKGVFLIGGAQIPIIGNPALMAPENDQNTPIIGNWYESRNFLAGLINPVVTFNFAVRDTPSEIFASSFLNPFFARTNDVAHDTTIIAGGIKFWDGRSGFALNGVKADMLSLSLSKQGGIQVSGRFCASNAEGTDAIVALGSAPPFVAWDDTPLLGGQHIDFAAPWADVVWNASMALANNHRPNMAMNGSRFPQDQNASQQTASCSLTVRAADTEPVDGTAIQAIISGSTFLRRFTIVNPRSQTKKNREIGTPETFRTHAFKCAGGANNTPAFTFAVT